jgi:hypothetical protein
MTTVIPHCLWREDDGDICRAIATDEVTISGRTGSAKVPVCPRHKAAHNERAAAIRTKAAKP